ncbi:MAG: peptide-methionine (S)-S-oxide reductase [Xanthobacteraceae bacterium]|nr:MAG: peptide-methionine (S)-S-oxide reductase [Xanthobacteraceae bacterium]
MPLRPDRRRALPLIAALLALPLIARPVPAGEAMTLPPPTADLPPGDGPQTVVLAGGCFWGVQAVYQHTKGVVRAISGYAGGGAESARYDLVSRGNTGHAEAVEVTYDPKQISYGRILQIFFSVAHDPTQLNRQDNDVGTQYRSAIFFRDGEQKRAAQAYIDQLTATKAFARPIVTRLDPLGAFYRAEAYHQDYATLHPNQPYIYFNDRPKIENLKKTFGDVYRSTPVLIGQAQTN